MARMRGKQIPEHLRNELRYAAEYALWTRFKEQLSDKYCVVRSIPWLGKDRHGRLLDGDHHSDTYLHDTQIGDHEQ